MPDEVDPGSRDLGSRDHLANLLERLLLLAIPVRVDATLCAPDESGSRAQAVTRCACGRTHNPIRLRVGVAGEILVSHALRCATAVALYFMSYNFGGIHRTLRVTPAMEAGVANHVWNIEETVVLMK